MPSFQLMITADFGRDMVYERIVGALQVRQTSLVIDEVKQIKDPKNPDRPLKTSVKVSLPEAVTRDQFADWVLETIRNEYNGPGFAVLIDRIYEDPISTTSTTTTTLKP